MYLHATHKGHTILPSLLTAKRNMCKRYSKTQFKKGVLICIYMSKLELGYQPRCFTFLCSMGQYTLFMTDLVTLFHWVDLGTESLIWWSYVVPFAIIITLGFII